MLSIFWIVQHCLSSFGISITAFCLLICKIPKTWPQSFSAACDVLLNPSEHLQEYILHLFMCLTQRLQQRSSEFFSIFSVGLLESVINLDNNNNNLWLLFSMAAVTPVTCKTLNSGQSSSKSLPSSLFAYLLVIDLHRGTHFEQMPSKPRCSHSQTLHPLLCQLSPAAIATWLSLPLI